MAQVRSSPDDLLRVARLARGFSMEVFPPRLPSVGHRARQLLGANLPWGGPGSSVMPPEGGSLRSLGALGVSRMALEGRSVHLAWRASTPRETAVEAPDPRLPTVPSP